MSNRVHHPPSSAGPLAPLSNHMGPTGKTIMPYTDMIKVISLVLQRAYRVRHYSTVRDVLNTLPGTAVRDVLQNLAMDTVSVLLAQAVQEADLAYILTLLSRSYDNINKTIKLEDLQVLMRKLDVSAIRELLHRGCDINRVNAQGYSMLWFSSLAAQIDVVTVLLEAQANVNVQTFEGLTPLFAVSELGYTNVAKQLLEYRADVNTVDNKGATPLWIACQNGHDQITQLLLETKANVNQPANDGTTPLYKASGLGGNVKIVSQLLDAGASVNTATVSGHTPLTTACAYGRLEVMKLLTEKQANFCHKSAHSATPLFVACSACHYDVVEYCLQQSRDMQKADLGHSPLHASIFLDSEQVAYYLEPFFVAIENKSYDELKVLKTKSYPSASFVLSGTSKEMRIKVVKLLLRLGCIKDLNDRTDAGETAFFLACTQGFTEIGEVLRKAGANITLSDFVGCSPLATAVVHNRLDTVKWLLTLPETEVNATDHAGCTPLFRAAEFNRVEIVNYLVGYGCNVNIMNNEHVSPIAMACKLGHSEVVAAMLELNETAHGSLRLVNKEGESVIHFACAGGNCDVLKLLMMHDLDPCKADIRGNTPLHITCQLLQTECIDVLLTKVKDVNVVNRHKDSPLMVIPCGDVRAKEKEQSKCLIVAAKLLAAGANVNQQDYKGYTLLFGACERNNIDLASFLVLKHGAQAHIRDNLGGSLLHAAVSSIVMFPSDSMIDWIIEQGLSVNDQNCDGLTPLHLSAILGRSDTSKYLVGKGANILATDKLGITPLCHMTRFPEDFKLFFPHAHTKCTKEMVEMLCRFSKWWQTYSNGGIKQELESLNVCHVDLLQVPQIPAERYFPTVCHLAEWKERHFPNEANDISFLLQTYGQVTNSEIAKTIISHLDSFINTLARRISPQAAFTPIQAGSLSEGTKAMQPNEGDYILQQLVISIDDFEIPMSCTQAADFARLKVKKEAVANLKANHSQLITGLEGTEDLYLCRNNLFINSYRHVGEVFQDPEFWKIIPMFYRLSSTDVEPNDVSIRHLDLIYSGENCSWMPLDVDLVPAIDSPNWYPPWCRQDEFCQKYLKKNGCRFIAKWAIGAHEDPTLFRVSFEKCEKELFYTMPMSLKKAYQLGKILKSFCPRVGNWLEAPGSFITSYHMKTTIFGIFEEYSQEVLDHGPQKPEFNVEQVIYFTKQMFSKLTDSYKNQNLRSFWLPGENLLIDAKYGQYGWCASNYARLLHWMLEPGLQVPTFLKSTSDTQPTAQSQPGTEVSETVMAP